MKISLYYNKMGKNHFVATFLMKSVIVVTDIQSSYWYYCRAVPVCTCTQHVVQYNSNSELFFNIVKRFIFVVCFLWGRNCILNL